MWSPLLVPVALLITTAASQLEAIRVLKSRIKVGSHDPDEISGARLLDERRIKVRDVTFCIRFNLPVGACDSTLTRE